MGSIGGQQQESEVHTPRSRPFAFPRILVQPALMHSRVFVCSLSLLTLVLLAVRPLPAQPKAEEAPQPAAPPVAGGYEPVPITAEMTRLGETATRLQSEKEGTPLIFAKVALAEAQVVAGMNYRLKLELTSEKGKTQTAVAVIYQDLTKKLSLTSWEWLKK